MSGDDLLDWVRLLTVPLSVFTAVVYIVRVNYVWELLNRGERVVHAGLALLMFAVAYRSTESHIQGNDPGVGVVAYMAALAVVLVGLWILRRR